MNAVQLCGRLTRDAEVRFVGEKKTPLAKLGLAVDTPTGKESDVTFLDITAWGSVAERCEGLRKGDAVFVAGKLKTESWEDRQTGARRSKLAVVAEIVGPGLLRHESKGKPRDDQREPALASNDYGGAPADETVPF